MPRTRTPSLIADRNGAVVSTIGAMPVAFDRSRTLFRATHREPVYRWKLEYLPANVVDALSR
jgi:hypothetical protein